MTQIMREIVKFPFVLKIQGTLFTTFQQGVRSLSLWYCEHFPTICEWRAVILGASDQGPHLALLTARDVKEISLRGFKLRYRSEFRGGKF